MNQHEIDLRTAIEQALTLYALRTGNTVRSIKVVQNSANESAVTVKPWSTRSTARR